ncbi:MAG: hypothetical protein CBB67_013345 [Alteromonadaceae bacterium TMED7]|nr:hypothetical protein [Alteromonadaceae bacterium]RPH17203.1 MAG: hypothetical protein CBB67_013345 [Alteromonadaceae bacterium TMED7]
MEIIVLRTLHSLGFRYSSHNKNLPSCPVIVRKSTTICVIYLMYASGSITRGAKIRIFP